MLPEMCFMQYRLDMFDVTCEDVCYDSLSVRDFGNVGTACPTTARCTGSCRITTAFTTSTWASGASPITKNLLGSALSRAGWSVKMGLSDPGPHDGPNGTGAGSGAEASVCARANTPARSLDVLSATQK